ncbi:hypothetical protein GH714_027157 [Hevea brasiliensis]|uniref:VTT domain-containing protein n=1 Tax=Hevea brasiliensis TaxID=3981 RepID=A0A6A6MHL4_HEVBR|nr:hypothetical protein GH714_027157 [Hevea brasiliensis]
MPKWWKVAVVVGIVGIFRELSKQLGWDKDAALQVFALWSDRLGMWAMPVYVGIHTLTLALCLPYAVFFEAGASLLFGFLPAVLCVFSAKVVVHMVHEQNPDHSFCLTFGHMIRLGWSSIKIWLVFKSSSSAMEWAQRNRYFHLLSRGVERDGWRFVLLARFSPMPSYVINYALAATKVGFLVDFLLPTVIGCLPMILQNTSIGSLAGAAVASTSGSQKSKVWSYLFPILGIVSSILISLRIKKYSTDVTMVASPSNHAGDCNDVDSSPTLSGRTGGDSLKKSQ